MEIPAAFIDCCALEPTFDEYFDSPILAYYYHIPYVDIFTQNVIDDYFMAIFDHMKHVKDWEVDHDKESITWYSGDKVIRCYTERNAFIAQIDNICLFMQEKDNKLKFGTNLFSATIDDFSFSTIDLVKLINNKDMNYLIAFLYFSVKL